MVTLSQFFSEESNRTYIDLVNILRRARSEEAGLPLMEIARAIREVLSEDEIRIIVNVNLKEFKDEN